MVTSPAGGSSSILSMAGSKVVSAPQSISPPNDIDDGPELLKKLNGEDDG